MASADVAERSNPNGKLIGSHSKGISWLQHVGNDSGITPSSKIAARKEKERLETTEPPQTKPH